MKISILELLEKNSRLTNEELATMLDIPVDEVENEISEMEYSQIVCGYNTLINWDKTEKEFVTALIELKVTPQRGQGFDNIAERIYKYKEVKAVYLMSGGYDLTVIIEGKNLKEVALFVSEKLAPLESVLSTATHFVLKKYKDHGIIFEQECDDERMIITP